MKEDINFHEIQQERRKTLPSVLKQTPEDYKAEVKKVLDETEEKASEFNTKNFPTLTLAKERLKSDKIKSEQGRFLDQSAIEQEIPQFSSIETLSKKLAETEDFEMTLLHKKRTDPYAKTIEPILKTVGKEKVRLLAELEAVERENPNAFRAHELVSYKKDLHMEGHIAHTPSVEAHLQEIGRRIIVGKPMFLHGPTGTGKTSLARSAAKKFTNKNPEMVYCTPQTKESNIWGKTGIRPTKDGQIETVEIYGPLAKAMSEGRIVVFDEFTALPQEQMVFIKGIMSAKIGDKENVVGNGQVEIKSGFQIICTANLKSDKNPERASLPPEIAREFEQNNLEIGYTPKEESYDIMLARLMNPDGSIDISYEDLNTTLKLFSEALDEIQSAFTDRVSSDTARLSGMMDASGKVPGLKKLVLTQGTVEAIMDGWKVEKQINLGHVSFTEFLDTRLQTTLTFKEYSEADRTLAAKILASKGFLRTLRAEDLGLPSSVFDFDVAKKARGDSEVEELKKKSANEKHISLSELATIDPFNTRGIEARAEAESFLPEGSRVKNKPTQESKEISNANIDDFLMEMFTSLGVDQTKIDQWVQNKKVEVISPSQIVYENLKNDTDPSKYGEYIMNPGTKDIDWNNIPVDKIKSMKLQDSFNSNKLDAIGEHCKGLVGKLPGLEYYKYIIENPDKAPDSLKDGNYHFFFGSVFRRSNGYWDVPYVRWDGSGWSRDSVWLGSGWYGDYRVVLLEN